MNWQINHHLPGITISCISVTWWPASITPTRISLSSERLKSSAMSLTMPIGIWSPPTVQQESDRLSHHRQSGSRKQSSRNLKLRRWAWWWGHWGWVFGNYSTCNVLYFKQRSGRCHNHFSEPGLLACMKPLGTRYQERGRKPKSPASSGSIRPWVWTHLLEDTCLGSEVLTWLAERVYERYPCIHRKPEWNA